MALLAFQAHFSSSLAESGISLFPMKGNRNEKSDLTAVFVCVKYITVASFRQIGRGLYIVLPEGVKFPPIHTWVKIQNSVHSHRNLWEHSFMQYILNAEIHFVFAVLFI